MPAAEPPALTERFLLVVTGLVIEDGGDEDEAIAAMLHDAVEDGGGRAMPVRIARSFGRPLTEDLLRAVDELARLVASDDAAGNHDRALAAAALR